MAKSLSLYIEKWYIIGAICTDNIIRPICLPNHEDRIWLYFYEDIANDEISYGKGYQKNFRDKELHYHGDVFSQITCSSATYTMFKRPQPLKEIFKSAKIFDDLRSEMEQEKEITTFVSFSQDIGSAARLIFLNELQKEGFIVKEHVARIEHLSLEYALKKNLFDEAGYYLVVNACNENLHYSIYQKTEDIFVRVNEDNLIGLGTDVRSRALIEDLVDKINDKEYILKTEDERESEYLRMTQFVDDWIVKLGTARDGIPVHITNITFSLDPFKSYSVQVRKSKIDERTAKIVKDIVNTINEFTKTSNLTHEMITGVILLSDTFTNTQFREELRISYSLDDEHIVNFKDIDLSSIVSSYNFIDCDQFSTATNKQRKDAEAELLRIKNAEEEKLSRQKAEEEERVRIEKERAATDSDKKFKEACDRGFEYEKEHDYEQMLFYFSTALDFKPNDEVAKQKYEEAQQLKAKQTILVQNYSKKIHLAKEALESGDYEVAKQKSVEALSDFPDSHEAIDIKNKADRHIKHTKELESILVRADVFIAQKTFKEALVELEKAKALDLDSDSEVKQRIELIKKEQEDTLNKIESLIVSMNTALNVKNYTKAIDVCNNLLDIDFVNSRKWSTKIADIQQTEKKEKEQEKQLKRLIEDIDTSWYNEDWSNVATLCANALLIKEDMGVRNKLEKAEEKIAFQKLMQELDGTVAQIKDLILSSDFSEAREKLSELRRMSLDDVHKRKIKELNQLIFQKEEEAEAKQTIPEWVDFENSRTRVLEVKQKTKRKLVNSNTNSLITSSDFDFGSNKSIEDNNGMKEKIDKSVNKSSTINDSDFFSSGNETQRTDKNKSKVKAKKVSNKDFDF